MALILFLLSALLFGCFPDVTAAQTDDTMLPNAVFYGNCENGGIIERSDDSSATWREIGNFPNWYTTPGIGLPDVSTKTRLRITCEKGRSGKSGFRGQVNLGSNDIYVTASGSIWEVISPANTALEYTVKGQSGFQAPYEGGFANVLDSAAWITAQTQKMVLKFSFYHLLADGVVFEGSCKSKGQLLFKAQPNLEFQILKYYGNWNEWSDTLTEKIATVGPGSTLQVRCRDSTGVGSFGVNYGGFVGSVTLKGKSYYTSKPLKRSGGWRIVDEDDNKISYACLKGQVNPRADKAREIGEDACWVWKNEISGTKDKPKTFVFEFDFGEALKSVVPYAPVEVVPVNEPDDFVPVENYYGDYAMLDAVKKTPVATPVSGVYYLTLVTCALLVMNGVLLVYGWCAKRRTVKYELVDLDSDSEIVGMKNINVA